MKHNLYVPRLKWEKEGAVFGFFDEHRYLSNFWYCNVTYKNRTFPSTEHAYQAAKSLSRKVREQFSSIQLSPGAAKKLGRQIEIRSDWEEVKEHIMLRLLRRKFKPGTELAEKLLGTGKLLLVEANTWNDLYWGTDPDGNGKNRLGVLLMKVRRELRYWQKTGEVMPLHKDKESYRGFNTVRRSVKKDTKRYGKVHY